MTPDKVEEIERTLQNLSFWNILDTDEQCELRTTLTQHHQDLMSEAVEEIRNQVFKNGYAGTLAGFRIHGKSYDADLNKVEEIHEEDCPCCRKNLFKTK